LIDFFFIELPFDYPKLLSLVYPNLSVDVKISAGYGNDTEFDSSSEL